MKNSILALALGLTLAPPAWSNHHEEAGEAPPGQAQEPEAGFPERFAERLDEKLKLSDDQRKKVKAILAEAEPGMKKRKEELKALREKMKAAMKEMTAEMRQAKEKIRETLSYEQRDEFDSMMARHKMMRMRQGGMGMGGRRGGRMKGGMGGEGMSREGGMGPGRGDETDGEERGGPPED